MGCSGPGDLHAACALCPFPLGDMYVINTSLFSDQNRASVDPCPNPPGLWGRAPIHLSSWWWGQGETGKQRARPWPHSGGGATSLCDCTRLFLTVDSVEQVAGQPWVPMIGLAQVPGRVALLGFLRGPPPPDVQAEGRGFQACPSTFAELWASWVGLEHGGPHVPVCAGRGRPWPLELVLVLLGVITVPVPRGVCPAPTNEG